MNHTRTALVAVCLFLAAVAVAQTRTVTMDAADYRPTGVQLEPLPDGGCSARWCGEVTDSDNVPQRACTELVDLRAALNRNRCAALVEAGAARVMRELRLPVDGGEP